MHNTLHLLPLPKFVFGKVLVAFTFCISLLLNVLMISDCDAVD